MDFLGGRTQRTRVGAAYYETIDMASGIVQVSCIGPILFVIYANDVVDYFDNKFVCRIYADDVKLYTSDYIWSVSDCNRLQLATDRLISWTNKKNCESQ